MPCIEVKTKKYQSRNSPPYHANDCPGQTKTGNDGKPWKSVANKKMIYKWVAINSSSIKGTTIKKDKISRGKTYYIHDNGRYPFKVVCDYSNKKALVYKFTHYLNKEGEYDPISIYDKLLMTIKYDKIFTGNTKSHYDTGNSILLCTGVGKYIYIGSVIYSFETGKSIDDEIINYYSPIGANDIPYPYAVSKNKTYIMDECIILDNQKIEQEKEYAIKNCNIDLEDDLHIISIYNGCFRKDSKTLKRTKTKGMRGDGDKLKIRLLHNRLPYSITNLPV